MFLKREMPTVNDVAEISASTSVKVLEYDLALFRDSRDCRDWPRMIDNWAKIGAHISLYCQRVHPAAVQNLRNLKLSHRDRVQVYDISDIPDNVMPTRVKGKKYLTREEFMGKFTTFHFMLFDNPAQAWIESYHGIDSNNMCDCEFVPARDAANDERLDFYRRVFDNLKKYSKPAKL